MRVLFLAHSFPRCVGDVPGAFLLRLAIALRDEGVEVHVVAPASAGVPAREELEGISVERFRYAPRSAEKLAYTGSMAADVKKSWTAKMVMASFLGAAFVAAVRMRRNILPDIVHAHWWFPGGLVGTWVSALAGVPLITTMHGSDVRLARGAAAARPALRHVVRRSAAVTVVSSWLARELQEAVPSVRPIVAPMPVDTELFTPGGDRARDRLLFVGRLTEQKGVHHLLRAMPLMRRHAVLDIVGDGPERGALEALAAELQLSERVRFHGSLTPENLVPFYREAGAVIVPSVDEGLGLVAVEALMCAAPVIASASGGLTDVIRHDRTGLLVQQGEPEPLAEAADALLTDVARADALGQAGRLHVLATFAPGSVARRYAELYRSASEEKR
jgi:glycosyltransferase involved in cell wall biosynthesis